MPPILAQDTPTDLPTATETPSATATLTETASQTPTYTETPTETPSETPSETPTATVVPTETPTETVSETATATLAEVPSATLTPETATATEAPTTTVTSTPLPPEPGLNLVYSETFNGERDFYHDLFGATWGIVPHDADFALYVYVDNAMTRLTGEIPLDVVVQGDFLVTAGAVRLTVRESAAGYYSAFLHANGQVELYRSAQLLAAVTLPAAGQWQALRLSAMGDVIRVSVDGIEIIELSDTAPLPVGMVSFMAVNLAGGALLADDLQLWTAGEEVSQQSFASGEMAFAPALAPLFSPDADYLTFSVGNTLDSLNLVDLSVNNGLPALPAEIARGWDPSWAQNGTRVAFMCDPAPVGGSSEICIMEADGSGLIRFAAPSGQFYTAPNLSPDGAQMVYRSVGGFGILGVVNLPNLDGGYGLNAPGTGGPEWGADGYVYYGGPASNPFIYRIPADGSGFSQQITSGSGCGGDSGPSVRGGQLAYETCALNGQGVQYYPVAVTSTGGGAPQVLTNSTDGNVEELTWLETTNAVAAVINNQIYRVPMSGPKSLLHNSGIGYQGFDTRLAQGAGTATPTVTPTIDPVRLAYYEQFIGIMFFAIYNETSENQTADQPQITVQSGDNSFTFHGDHRYLMAWTMITNIPFNDPANGVAFMGNWGGSIGNSEYSLWNFQGPVSVCTVNNSAAENAPTIGFYKDKTATLDILSWFNDYANCLRSDTLPVMPPGQLADVKMGFDAAYDEITQHIRQAINEYLSGDPHPLPGANYIKTTSVCYVWQRDAQGHLTSCRSGADSPNMSSYCAERPIGRNDNPYPPDRDCHMDEDHNTAEIDMAQWLQSPAAQQATQQLYLSTVVDAKYGINLGLYIPDQPLLDSGGNPISGLGCENYCFFLVRSNYNPGAINGTDVESIEDAWERHRYRFLNFPQYTPGFGVVGYAHTLRTEPTAKTWITVVFQEAA